MRRYLLLITTCFILFSFSTTALTAERDIDPPGYQPNEDLDHLFVGLEIKGLSADGETDWIYYRFPDFVYLDPRSVESNLSISSEEKLVDQNDDGVKETLVLGVNSNSSGDVTGDIVLDTAARIEAYRDFKINSTIQDSKYGNVTTVGDFVFEANGEYYRHPDNHTHSNNFSDAIVRHQDRPDWSEIPVVVRKLLKFLW